LKNAEDEHRVGERQLKQDLRSLKVSKKEQDTRQQEYANALHRSFNKSMTQMRNDHERLCNEIQLKYKERMVNLRTEMEKRRKKRIQMIETRKNAKIKECTLKHEKKYAEIKEYY